MSFTHLADVLAEVRPLGQLFADAGYRIFLVGGIVRDQLLNEPLDASSDIDLTTDALPAEIKRIVAPFAVDMWTQGERFGTIGLRAGARDFEITTHRAESYSSESRKPQVSFGDDIGVDLSRRDFTVNAMAIELPDGDLVDPYAGASDLAAKRLRTPLSADVSFTDDPLRMLRAARFATRFELIPDPQVVASATQLRERIRIVAIERIGVELRRLLGLEAARVGLGFLANTGLLAEVLSYGEPERITLVQPRLETAIAAVDRLAPEWRMRLAAIALTIFETTDGVVAMCERLRLSKDDERHIVRLSASALHVVEATEVTDETIRRWLDRCQDRAAALELASVLATDPVQVQSFGHAVDMLVSREDSAAMQYLDGKTVMALLDVEPGPVIGAAQRFLRERFFAAGPMTAIEQEAELLSWWAERPAQPGS